MINLLKFLLIYSVFVFRFYVVINVCLILFDFFQNKSQVPKEIIWYSAALLLDLYLLQIVNSIEINIYNKTTDEEKVD